jgi:hypothetical protein
MQTTAICSATTASDSLLLAAKDTVAITAVAGCAAAGSLAAMAHKCAACSA